MSCVKNPHLTRLSSDFLYHLALGTAQHDLVEMFGDVRFVCVGGTAKRMEAFAYYVGKELAVKLQTGVTLQDITQNANRYSMFKIGPVLSVTVGRSSKVASQRLKNFGSIYVLMYEHVSYLRRLFLTSPFSPFARALVYWQPLLRICLIFCVQRLTRVVSITFLPTVFSTIIIQRGALTVRASALVN